MLSEHKQLKLECLKAFASGFPKSKRTKISPKVVIEPQTDGRKIIRIITYRYSNVQRIIRMEMLRDVFKRHLPLKHQNKIARIGMMTPSEYSKFKRIVKNK